MRLPIILFAAREHVTRRYLYQEAAAGRLTLTKVGRRTFVDDADAAAWRALAPKVTGNSGARALCMAERTLRDVSAACDAGHLDRAAAINRLAQIAAEVGLQASAT